MYKSLFWLLARLGRPFGGIRPRRFTNWVAEKAYGRSVPADSDLRWYEDRAGSFFLLHPFFLIDRQIIAFGAYDAQTISFIDLYVRPGMTCLDVGANFGAITIPLARRAGPSGRVYAFEPVPHLFDRLRRNVEKNSYTDIVRAHRIALSDRTGEVVMRMAEPGFPNQGMGSIVHAPLAQVAVEKSIATTTLDEFVRSERLDRIDFIKVDIQGAEPLFLRGGEAALTEFRPDLLLEVSASDLGGMGVTSRDLLLQVESLGYDLYEITKFGQTGPAVKAEATSLDYTTSALYARAQGKRGEKRS
jgi:FkbM family methyltransferase